MYHRSVLLSESIHAMAIRPDGIYVDATYGGGGHAKAILEELKEGKLVAFDQDDAALKNKLDDPRLILIHSNFRFLRNFLKLYKLYPVDGILADLGISSYQIDQGERGFSTRFDGVLDMRMDRKKKLTARDIINHYPEEKLKILFQTYGEIVNARQVASVIIKNRKMKTVDTTGELKEITGICARRGKENKFFAQLFQALRIEVNQEMEVLQEFLKQTVDALKPGGRLVIISYHSLEDKLVKNFFRAGNIEGEIEKDFYGNVLSPFKVISRKPIIASETEITENNRSRSARLRVAEKL